MTSSSLASAPSPFRPSLARRRSCLPRRPPTRPPLARHSGFKQLEDFGRTEAYANYMRSVLQRGMRVEYFTPLSMAAPVHGFGHTVKARERPVGPTLPPRRPPRPLSPPFLLDVGAQVGEQGCVEASNRGAAVEVAWDGQMYGTSRVPYCCVKVLQQ